MQNELSIELRQNAELQQRVTSLELAAAERARNPPSPTLVEASEAERFKAERELREARREISVLKGQAEEMEAELASAHKELDQLQISSHAASRKGVQAREAAQSARIESLEGELESLKRHNAMASGAHRFAKWRIWLCVMQRKRAEQRAAQALSARRPAIAPSTEVIGEAVRLRLRPCRQTVIIRLLSRAGRPREAIARGLHRWHAAATSLAARDHLKAAATAAAAAAVASATEQARQSEAKADAARDEVLWARGEDSRVKQNAESMLREAIEAGDAQTRRVLQLQRGISQTRRTLAACLLRASFPPRAAASAPSRCTSGG